MEVIGFIFGISGMSIGVVALIFSMSALNRINELEDRFKDITSTGGDDANSSR